MITIAFIALATIVGYAIGRRCVEALRRDRVRRKRFKRFELPRKG